MATPGLSRLILAGLVTVAAFAAPASAADKVGEAVRITVRVTGQYRTQRQDLLYSILLVHSCTGYLDTDDYGDRFMTIYGRRDDIFAEILLQAISSVAHPRRDSAFDILLGLSKGFAEIGALDGEKHGFPSESSR